MSDTRTEHTLTEALSSDALRAFLDQNATPRALVELIEEASSELDGPYHTSYRELLAAFQADENPKAAELYRAFGTMDDWWQIEEPIRRAAFVHGFTMALRLLRSTLTTEAQ